MAGTTKGDEIFFDVPSHKAARLNVMNLKIFGTTALLASPAITPEHLLTKRPIEYPGPSEVWVVRARARSRCLRYPQQEFLPL